MSVETVQEAQHDTGTAVAYEYEETRELVALVTAAAALVGTKEIAAFSDFRVQGSRWRLGESYIFVLDLHGNMLVHPDPALEGRSALDLVDISGRPIVRGLIGAATVPGKPEGWFHYQWPVPGGLLARWKSSYVRLVTVPSGMSYVVGSGMYNDRMERTFVIDTVTAAVAAIERNADTAYASFRDPAGPFLFKDAYIFVMDRDSVELVNPVFPHLEGRKLIDLQDAAGKLLTREMFSVVEARGAGWVDYLWPKPGDSAATRKSAYVSRATVDGSWVLVGCGVYLPEAPRAVGATQMTATELMQLVREAASLLDARGEEAFPEFRSQGSRWLRDATYFFIWSDDGVVVLHAAEPGREGRNDGGLQDILGRPIGKMILETVDSPSGEGWIHYMYPEPGKIFPAWKSAFIKRVTFPSGRQHVIGSGIYNMRMDQAFIEDVVNRAAALVARHGREAFTRLRDKKGPFVFMDTYVFVLTPEGTQLVNAGQPSLEGRNLMEVRDLEGKAVVQDEIAAALRDGSAWLECYWYKPGDNTPARKQTYVRKVESGSETFIVGSGVYLRTEE